MADFLIKENETPWVAENYPNANTDEIILSPISFPYPEAFLRAVGLIGNNKPLNQVARAQLLGVPLAIETKIDGYLLPLQPFVTISGQKTVIKTAIAGRDFTVKEIISLEDYKVNIKGFGINTDKTQSGDLSLETTDFPYELLEKLRAIYEKKESVKIYNEILSRFNIELVVIESLKFIPIEGAENHFAYEMDCISDQNTELELIGENN